MLMNEEMTIDELVSTIEKRLCQFEKNVSHMQMKISEYKTVHKKIHESCAENWTRQIS